MRVPEVHLRHRTAERQVLGADVVMILRVGLDEGLGRRDHGRWTGVACDRRPGGGNYTRASAPQAAIVPRAASGHRAARLKRPSWHSTAASPPRAARGTPPPVR